MFYVKEKIGKNTEFKIEINYENVFCICPKCGSEVKVFLDDILQDKNSDLYNTSVYCDECSRITQEERTMNLYYELVTIKEQIPVSTYKTILGQIISGDIEGAQTGIKRMKEKLRRQAYDNKKI